MGVTPNRGYPYPDPASPMRITRDLEQLAKAVDADIKAEQDAIQQRPVFRLTGGRFPKYGAGATSDMLYDTIATNTGGALGIDSASLPLTRVVPLIPGLWGFTATAVYPSWRNIAWVKLSLYSTLWVGSTIATEMPNTADGTRTISVTGIQQMTGTSTGNSIRAVGQVNAAVNRPNFPFLSRSLTGFLLART